MDPDDGDLPRKSSALAARNLAPMSVEELDAYIGELEAEIARARQAIAGKKSVRAGAESLFRK